MPIAYPDILAQEDVRDYSWSDRDVMHYALSVGMGADPVDERELAFVYAVLRPVFWAIRKGTAPRGGGARPAARRDERAVR